MTLPGFSVFIQEDVEVTRTAYKRSGLDKGISDVCYEFISRGLCKLAIQSCCSYVYRCPTNQTKAKLIVCVNWPSIGLAPRFTFSLYSSLVQR